MAHTITDKKKLLSRIRRIQGQVEALGRAVDSEQECSAILQLIAACRGAIGGLMSEVIEEHIQFHVVNPDDKPTAAQIVAAREVIDVLRSYLK
jgi:FrmR/RcnR family transcriptional regulator, repressor of frmRAB operon